MKRVAAKLVCTALLIMLIAASVMPAMAGSWNKSYYVETQEPHERLNVHSTPDIGPGNIIDRLDDGVVVQYLSSEKGWWFVQYWICSDTFGYGYVDSDYLVSVAKNKTVKFTCVDNLYLHSQCDIGWGECAAYHIGQIPKGGKFTVLKENGSWVYVQYGETKGWVATKYLVKAD